MENTVCILVFILRDNSKRKSYLIWRITSAWKVTTPTNMPLLPKEQCSNIMANPIKYESTTRKKNNFSILCVSLG